MVNLLDILNENLLEILGKLPGDFEGLVGLVDVGDTCRRLRLLCQTGRASQGD